MLPLNQTTTVENILKKYRQDSSQLIFILKDVQNEYGYLPKEVLKIISQQLNLPLSKLFKVVTFYNSFCLEPKGKNVIKVCTGTTCYLKKGGTVADKISKELRLVDGKSTSPDNQFTLKKVYCLGCCSVAPAIKVNEDIFGQVTEETIREIFNRYRKL